MQIKTYRAGTLREALNLVRTDLGPDAAVLHTREVRGSGLLHWLTGTRHIEVTASHGVHVPSRLPQRIREQPPETPQPPAEPATSAAPPEQTARPAAVEHDYRAQFRRNVSQQAGNLESMVEALCDRRESQARQELPEALFHVFTDLIEADVDEDVARGLVHRIQQGACPDDLANPAQLKARVARLIEDDISVSGPIQLTPGKRRLVALVGPTGVGKTTTIAKLAASFRLRQKLRVGLITVDTYRIAAVEQLRTYADIIDLPMDVVATPREMRESVARMDDLDLVLMDTAGRSPRDEVRILELKSMLAEAGADEVHLVLSSVSGTNHLVNTARKFANVGTTALILTKLDEATGLGNLLPLLGQGRLPLSYLTHGQNVPEDIAVADRRRLMAMMLGVEESPSCA